MPTKGTITCSQYDRLVKLDGTMRSGDTPMTYLRTLLAERLGYEPDDITSASLEHGREWEEFARKEYETATFQIVTLPDEPLRHSIINTTGLPDGFVGDDGLIEIKCPWNPANHIRTMIDRDVPDEYKAQIQGYLWLSGREWCDFVSFDPRLDEQYRLVVVRVWRDDGYIANLAESIQRWSDKLDAMYENVVR